MTGLLLFISLVAVLAAFYFFSSHRTTSGQLAGKEEAFRKLEEQAAAATREAQALRAEAKERRDESAQLRDQLREAKKKAFDQSETVKKAAGASASRVESFSISSRRAGAPAAFFTVSDWSKAFFLASRS
jgi:Tfp pilus assembly protein PilO